MGIIIGYPIPVVNRDKRLEKHPPIMNSSRRMEEKKKKQAGIQKVVGIQKADAPLPPDVVRARLQALEAAAVELADASMSPATKKAYESDMHQFGAWCWQHGRLECPADAQTVTLYITWLARGDGPIKSTATIRRRIAAIAKWHELLGHADPTDSEHLRRIWKGIRRELGIKPRQKTALTRQDLHECVDTISTDAIQGLQERGLLLFGLESAMRRDELSKLSMSWLTFGTEGVLVTIPSSKTNQEGDIEEIVIERRDDAYCAVAAIEKWIAACDIKTGTVFRQFSRRGELLINKSLSGWGIARIIKKTVGRVDPDNIGDFSGHSLRRGYVTTEHRAGKTIEKIMEQTRHSVDATVRRYIEHDDLLKRIGKKI